MKKNENEILTSLNMSLDKIKYKDEEFVRHDVPDLCCVCDTLTFYRATKHFDNWFCSEYCFNVFLDDYNNWVGKLEADRDWEYKVWLENYENS